jgi:hypothetical protein
MKVYRDSGRTAPVTFNTELDADEWSVSHSGRFTPGERATAALEQQCGWAPEMDGAF